MIRMWPSGKVLAIGPSPARGPADVPASPGKAEATVRKPSRGGVGWESRRTSFAATAQEGVWPHLRPTTSPSCWWPGVTATKAAFERLVPLVYAELRRMAHRRMRDERPDHVLQTTALINEAYIRLIDINRVRWQNRAHFFAVSAQVMRRILVDAARERGARKRGGEISHVIFDEALMPTPERGSDLVALDAALQALSKVDPRKGQVVELRYFGGLSVEETAEVLKVSPRNGRP